jgi:hypothetical protein
VSRSNWVAVGRSQRMSADGAGLAVAEGPAVADGPDVREGTAVLEGLAADGVTSDEGVTACDAVASLEGGAVVWGVSVLSPTAVSAAGLDPQADERIATATSRTAAIPGIEGIDDLTRGWLLRRSRN